MARVFFLDICVVFYIVFHCPTDNMLLQTESPILTVILHWTAVGLGNVNNVRKALKRNAM